MEGLAEMNTNLWATNIYLTHYQYSEHWWKKPVESGWIIVSAIAGIAVGYLVVKLIRKRRLYER